MLGVAELVASHFGLLLVVAQRTDTSHLPTHLNRQGVCLAGRIVVATVWIPRFADSSAWIEVETWDISQFGTLQSIVGFVDAQLGILHVGILLQSTLDECLKFRVSENVSPLQVAQTVVASGLHVAINAVCNDVGRTLVVLVELAGTQKHGPHQTTPKGGFLNAYAHFLFSYFLVI